MDARDARAISGVQIVGQGHIKATGAVCYGATSASEVDTLHLIAWNEQASEWQCDCAGYAFRHKCRHVDALAVRLACEKWRLTEKGQAVLEAERALEEARKRVQSMRRGPAAFSILR